MGNYKFRLSDMIPNAWFYKLKDMGNKPKPRNQNKTSHHSTNKKHTSSSKPKPPPQQQPYQFIQHRNSYYFNTTEAFRSSEKLYNSPINPKATDDHFPDSPRKSSKRKSRKRPIKPNSKLVSSSVSAGCSCRATFDSMWLKSNSNSDSSSLPSPESNFHEPAFEEFDPQGVWSSNSCSCRVSSSATDIIIDVDSSTTTSTTTTKSSGHKFDVLDSISELELPPILTKPVKFNEMDCNIKNRESHVETVETEETGESIRVRRRPVKGDGKFDKVDKVHKTVNQKQHRISPKNSAMSPGVKLRLNSPRIASKKIQASTRKTTIGATTTNSNTNKTSSMSRRKRVSESFAIVKSSFDPQRDFRESMVEMIVENNIRASKDLEELLACYLSMNSNEYHDLIVKVFEQIWFDLTDI